VAVVGTTKGHEEIADAYQMNTRWHTCKASKPKLFPDGKERSDTITREEYLRQLKQQERHD
jgi:hypothetical protein